MDLKERAAKIVALLEDEYPEALCTLDYTDPFRLLVSEWVSIPIVSRPIIFETASCVDCSLPPR